MSSRLTTWLRGKGILRPKTFAAPGVITAGRHTYGINSQTVLYATEDARLTIGAFCSLAAGVKILCDGQHDTEAATTFPIEPRLLKRPLSRPNAGRKRGVVIGNDVWIGMDAVILPGVAIGDGAVIGANAVVTKDVPPYAVVGGVPAKVMRYRFPKDTIARLLALRWWDWSDDEIKAEADALVGPIDAFLARHSQVTTMLPPLPVAAPPVVVKRMRSKVAATSTDP
jgi:acetyltransferase-like isoleucine patch superfamily enzyme